MSLLSGLNTDSDAQGERDSVGGSFTLESGVYDFEITMAFLQKAASGAIGLNLHFKTKDYKEYRETVYIQSGDAKGNKTYYVNKKGEKFNLPGFSTANGLALLTVGQDLAALAGTTEEKVVNVYSPDAKADVPTKVECLVDLIGQRILAGVQKQIEDKNQRGDDGKYYPTGETRETNEIDKLFCARESHYGMTLAEIQAEAEEAVFIETWKAKFTGVTRDRTTKDGGQSGTAGAPGKPAAAATAGNSKPTKSLFG